MWLDLADVMRFAAPPALWERLAADSSVAPALLERADCLGQALDALDTASSGATPSQAGGMSNATATTAPSPGLSTASNNDPAAEDAADEDAVQQTARQERACQLLDHQALCVSGWHTLQGQPHMPHTFRERTLLAATLLRMVRHIDSSPSMPGVLYSILCSCLHCALGKVGGRH
jgi:hypothetical protein